VRGVLTKLLIEGEGEEENKTEEPKIVPTPTQTTTQPGPAKKKRKVTRSTGDEDGDDRDYRPSLKKKKQRAELEVDASAAVPEEEDVDNPLPGYLDPITFEEVCKPAISPYGHVLGYQTWLKSLLQDPKNVCPITKQPLNKRDLVLLTWENIEQYRDKIIHL